MVKGNQLRLFFAVELSPMVQVALLDIRDQVADQIINPEARPVPGENFHITLSFLGNQPEKKLEAILDNFEPPRVSPFELNLTHLVHWVKPKIVAAAVEDKNDNLKQCKQAIEASLTSFEHFQFDRKTFKPHVTLFRKVDVPPKNDLDLNLTVRVDRISLMESQQSRNGVIYNCIESWPLRHASLKKHLLGQ